MHSPECTLQPHGDESPCGRPSEKPGEPCQFCGVPVGDGPCADCWSPVPTSLPEIKGLFARNDLSVTLEG